MPSEDLEKIARNIIAEAKRAGATDCDVTISTRSAVETTVRMGEVEKLEGAQMRGVEFRALVGHKSASTSTSDLSASAIKQMVRDTIAMAEASEADPYSGLPEVEDLCTGYPELNLYDPSIAEIAVERKIELAMAAESAAREADSRITNSDGASFNDSSGAFIHANSRGFVGGYQGSHVSLSAGVVASKDGEMQTGGWWATSRDFKGLESPEKVGKTAAQRALRQLGARKVKSQEVPVIYDPLMAARLLSQFIGAASGAHIYRKSSFMVDKLGEMVANSIVTVIDDPLMPGRLGSKPFDSEGMKCQTRTLIKDGRLETYLLSSYAGRKLNCKPNSGSVGNLYLKPGDSTPESIIESVKNGLLLTSVSGMGFNAVTGDYSMGASGTWIENGKLAYPVSGITVAGNVLEMFGNIEAIGNDLNFRSSTVSPTIKISKMTVAGE
ncbi:MAG: TldD/PmbA family protein [Candidatus Obscuribacter sp.]|jgi:PmbA protein|nr:TldD/PmbA family protein [Candidatus Obscuribacter sp.]MBK9200935.1 TldD/PmbA family protein [Candidatus Obscuribacter sp.]MBK9621615.1 TldD/PmbA family protein [Candidatus Obscuribacter sp.]